MTIRSKAVGEMVEGWWMDLGGDHIRYQGEVSIKTALDNLISRIQTLCEADARRREEEAVREAFEIFRWLEGYTDFPMRQEGEGAFYWRSKMRLKVLAAFPTYQDYLSTHSGETQGKEKI